MINDSLAPLPPTAPAVQVRLMFVQIKRRSVVIDGLAGHHALSIRAFMPWSLWALSAVAVLQMWADEGREVLVQFQSEGLHRPGPQVTISSRDTYMVLDIFDLAEHPMTNSPEGQAV